MFGVLTKNILQIEKNNLISTIYSVSSNLVCVVFSYKKYLLGPILAIAFYGVAFDSSASYADEDYQDYGLHKIRKKRARQPKYYASASLAYPLYLDIGNRAKHNDVDAGLALSKPTKRPMYSVAAGMRTDFNNQIAVELEALYYRGKSSRDFFGTKFNAKLESMSLLLNYYYIFDGWDGFHPMVGVGAGVSRNRVNKMHVVSVPSDAVGTIKYGAKTSPAFQGVLGVSKDITDSLSVQVKLRAMSLGKFAMEKTEGRFNSVALSGDIGLKYSFSHFKSLKKKSRRG